MTPAVARHSNAETNVNKSLAMRRGIRLGIGMPSYAGRELRCEESHICRSVESDLLISRCLNFARRSRISRAANFRLFARETRETREKWMKKACPIDLREGNFDRIAPASSDNFQTVDLADYTDARDSILTLIRQLTTQLVVLKAANAPASHKMYCSKCGSLEDKVIDSRLSKDGRSIRRRRECVDCHNRFTTYEEIERADLRVTKRDGRSEPLNRQKLLSGMIKACEKRPVSIETLEKATDEILLDLEAEFRREIPSSVIGAKVMEKLHQFDEVAYVRYASVYRHFQDIGEFLEEIQALGRRQKPSLLQPELFK